MATLRPETERAIEAAERALSLTSRGSGEIRFKHGRDVVTEADVAVEDLIRARLGDDSACPVIGEERGGRQGSGDSYWLADPICGTRNFASGIPLFSVNMALIEGDDVAVSVVGDGSTGIIYYAEKGRGAWAQNGREAVPQRASVDSLIVNMDGWPRSPEEGVRAFQAARFGAASINLDLWDVRSLSTTLGLAYVAAGRMAAHVLFSTPALHAGAGALLAAEAGATISDLDGAAWGVDSESLVVAADIELHRTLVTMLDEAKTLTSGI